MPVATSELEELERKVTELEKRALERERSRRWSSARSARGANECSTPHARLGCTVATERPEGREKCSPPPFSQTMKAWGAFRVFLIGRQAGEGRHPPPNSESHEVGSAG